MSGFGWRYMVPSVRTAQALMEAYLSLISLSHHQSVKITFYHPLSIPIFKMQIFPPTQQLITAAAEYQIHHRITLKFKLILIINIEFFPFSISLFSTFIKSFKTLNFNILFDQLERTTINSKSPFSYSFFCPGSLVRK